MKTSILMEGGGLRGIFTCGVIDVLMEHNISFDGAAGISAGACFGCNLKSRQVGRGLRYNLNYINDDRYMSVKSLLTTGDYFNADFAYNVLPNRLDPFDYEAFAANPMELYVGATDIDSGRIVYHLCKDGHGTDMVWLRAGASLPYISRPVKINGRRYLDGGLVEPVPIKFMEKRGYDRNLVVLTQPRGYVKEPSSNSLLLKATSLGNPVIYNAMTKRHFRYNRTIAYCMEKEAEGSALVLCPPDILPAGRLERDINKLQATYDIGREVALKNLQRIREFLAQ